VKIKSISQASIRLTGFSIVLLGLSSLLNDVAFYWVVLIFFLQRGPISPLTDEITEPDEYPIPFIDETLASF